MEERNKKVPAVEYKRVDRKTTEKRMETYYAGMEKIRQKKERKEGN